MIDQRQPLRLPVLGASPSLSWCHPTTAYGPWFCNFHIWQSPSFVDFFFLLKKDVGFFREIHLWLFVSDKQVNCILVNNFYQKTLLLISKNPVFRVLSLIMMTFLWKE